MISFCIALGFCILTFICLLVELLACYANLIRGNSYTCSIFCAIAFSGQTAFTVYLWLAFQAAN